ncbi:hypothetical protein OEIGOIKO_01423 [Streptomyces chrestomyceticus JCM 4735]|uniref:Uncharacterized protein n=1 Tax=Streptomyces chrestomyceticus JCM 4735 TaxID=1306181 RepID=A0A7U9PWW1_9ACTN|nr:hypothetical protein [Streptomyces chrestomyceticus]GCD33700.1 hypothetical protein OEIGOIKO_01423 [Streptomyces chrestomyceticus JCM 4735]
MNETNLAFVAIIISVVVGAVTFIYTHQQIKTAKEQTKSAKEQAESAREQAVSAREQAEAAKKANELTEKAQQEQVQPYVVADIRERVPGSQLVVFSIENTGPTMARDVKVSVDPPLRSTLGGESDQKLNAAVTREIPVLPPKRQLIFMLDVGHRLFASDLPRRYTVVVQAKGPFGAVEPLTYTIDLDVLRHSLLNRESLEWSTHVLAEEAKKARKAHERQANATTRLLRQFADELESRRSPESEPPNGAS